MRPCACNARDTKPGPHHADGCAIRYTTDQQPTATYTFVDTAGHRLHYWSGPPERYAVGFGPIKYIAKEEYLALLNPKGAL